MLLLLQFLRYRDAVCGILRTTKLATKRWEQMSEFLPQNFFRAFQSQFFLKCRKPHPDILKTVGGVAFSVKWELRKTKTEIMAFEFFLKKHKNCSNS